MEIIIKNARESVKHVPDVLKETTGELELEDIIIVALGLSIVDKAEDIVLLLKKERYDSVEIILRSVFEQIIYVQAILSENTKSRAKAFYASYHVQQGKKLKSIINLLDLNNNPEFDKVAKEQWAKDERFNSLDEYIDYFKDKFEDHVQPSRKNNYNYNTWYNTDGKTVNLRKLVTDLNDDVLDEVSYDYIYGLGSMESHGIRTMDQIDYVEESTLFSISKKIDREALISILIVLLNHMVKLLKKRYKVKYNNFYNTRLYNIKMNNRRIKQNGYKI